MSLRAGEWLVLGGSAVVVVFAVLVGAIVYVKPPPVEFVYLESPHARGGEAIYRREGCLSCHEIFGNGGRYGPDLDGIGSKRTREWLARYLRAPWPGVGDKPRRLVMPAVDTLDDVDLAALIEYLMALRRLDRDGRVLEPPPSRDEIVERGGRRRGDGIGAGYSSESGNGARARERNAAAALRSPEG